MNAPENPYAAPLSETGDHYADPEAEYAELAKKRRQQSTALAAAWFVGGLLTAGVYSWVWFGVWTPAALFLLVLANLVGVVWMAAGLMAMAGAASARGFGLLWSYLAAAFFLTHGNLLPAPALTLVILQGHRLRSFDRRLKTLAAEIAEAERRAGEGEAA